MLLLSLINSFFSSLEHSRMVLQLINDTVCNWHSHSQLGISISYSDDHLPFIGEMPTPGENDKSKGKDSQTSENNNH